MAKNISTNALRLLKQADIESTLHSYDTSDGLIDGLSVALKTGRDPSQVFKTLVTHSLPKVYHVFIIPVTKELDLKKAARAAGVKKIELIPVKELLNVTGYVKGGCSPVGMKKLFPSYLDKEGQNRETILVSAGRIGWQVELSPRDLLEFIGASCEYLT